MANYFRNVTLLLILLTVFVFDASASFSFKSHWEDKFNNKEKQHLVEWIQNVGDAVEKTLGTYPFEVQIYFHRSNGTNSPVPWAHTSRNGEEAVHFYVNPTFSLAELNADWTAAHEISHLSIPFVGQDNGWFAEGFASYFQWQIMYNQGIITHEELIDKYTTRLAATLPKYNSTRSFIQVANQLKKRYDFPSYYYGGACYFIQAEQQLKASNQPTLAQIISEYQSHRNLETGGLEQLINVLDKLSKSTIFKNIFTSFLNEPASKSVESTMYP